MEEATSQITHGVKQGKKMHPPGSTTVLAGESGSELFMLFVHKDLCILSTIALAKEAKFLPFSVQTISICNIKYTNVMSVLIQRKIIKYKKKLYTGNN